MESSNFHEGLSRINGGFIKFLAQLTVDGVNGRAGRYVQLHVVTELKNVNARAQNRAQNLVGKIVMVSVGKPRHVKQYHAQVSLLF